METKHRQHDLAEVHQLARKCAIQDSWSWPERESRKQASQVRQQWLVNHLLAQTAFHFPKLAVFQIPVASEQTCVLNKPVCNA